MSNAGVFFKLTELFSRCCFLKSAVCKYKRFAVWYAVVQKSNGGGGYGFNCVQFYSNKLPVKCISK
jgi:hypothetical protein